MDGLEFFTSQQLIEELMNRSTFAGVIVCSLEEQKEDDQRHKEFHLFTRAVPEDTIMILEKAANAMKQGMH